MKSFADIHSSAARSVQIGWLDSSVHGEQVMNDVVRIKTLEATAGWGRGRIYENITETIGHTPVVALNRYQAVENIPARILLKLEFFNPLSSVKDRIGVSLIDVLEQQGEIQPGKTVLVEPTSGNTGIALAFVAAARGYELILVMPESMSIERRKILAHLGAKLELTPAAGGMGAAIARAKELSETLPNAHIPGQFENPANPLVHERTTAEEIWKDTGGDLDAIVVGVGTGGTITGIGRVLKQRIPHLKIIAVEPEASPVLSGGQKGPHKIQGIGAGFVPAVLDTKVIDEVVTVSNDAAFETSRKVAKIEGIPGGISTGANVAAAAAVASRPEFKGKTVLTFAPSSAERYFSSDLFVHD
jgi:cysteine synthase A